MDMFSLARIEAHIQRLSGHITFWPFVAAVMVTVFAFIGRQWERIAAEGWAGAFIISILMTCAIFGAGSLVLICIAELRQRRNQPLQLSPTTAGVPPSQPAQVNLSTTPSPPPPAPPRRVLSEYEIGLKLPVIDKALEILNGDMEKVIISGNSLRVGWMVAVTSQENMPKYRNELGQHQHMWMENQIKLNQLRDANQQYQDIMIAAQQIYYNNCFPKVQKFVTAISNSNCSPP
jgi:hypothetical protein